MRSGIQLGDKAVHCGEPLSAYPLPLIIQKPKDSPVQAAVYPRSPTETVVSSSGSEHQLRTSDNGDC